VKRAKPFVRNARLAELDAFADQINEVDLLFDFCGSAD
jgi:hypothetical protein